VDSIVHRLSALEGANFIRVLATVGARIQVTLLLLVLSAIATTLPASGWSISALIAFGVVIIGAGLADHRLTLVSAVPVSMTILMVASVACGLLLAGLPVGWASRPVAVGVWWTVLLCASAWSVRRRAKPFLIIGPDAPVAVAGLIFLLGFCALAIVQPTQIWLRHVALGTDFARHLTILGQTVADGGLDIVGRGGYPRGVHTLVGLAWQTGGGADFSTAWSSLQGSTLLMLTAMLMGLTTASRQWARAIALKSFWRDWLIPAAITVAVVQGMWLSTMMASGFVVSIAAGMVLGAMLSVIAIPDSWPTTWLVGLLVLGTVAMAYSWPILVLVPGVVAASAWGASGFSIRGSLALSAGAVLSLPPLLALGSLTASSASYREEIVSGVPVLLWWPEWWWWLLAGSSAILAWRLWRVAPSSALALLIAWLCATASIIALALLTRTTASAPGYYLLKTIWSTSNLVLPAGAVGGAWILCAIWSHGAELRAPWGTVVKSGAALTVGLLIAAALGRLTANTQTWSNFTKGFGEVPLTLVTVDYLEDRGLSIRPGQAVAVWGLAPYGTLTTVQNAGMQDRYVTDAIRWLQPEIIRPEVPVTVGRDAAAMCRFLAANPTALRITGPNDDPGLGWLHAVGCPERTVRTPEWIRVPIDDEWFGYLAMWSQPYDYPDWETYRDLMRRQDPQWGNHGREGHA